ncbi:MAG TPA: CotH kinase family protein [Chitinispirillaceae bacterium]|nr:CotH kinase family protein [Chitinispirillaceae bacterium]
MNLKILFISLLINFCAYGASDVLINEVMPSNIDILMDDINEFPDSWVELYNSTDSPVNIQGWYVSDSALNKKKWKIVTSLLIPAKGYALLYIDEYDTLQLHANFKLDIDGGSLFLTASDGITIRDSITYNKMPPNLSCGRTIDGGTRSGWFRKGTPGYSNSTAYLVENNQVAPIPRFSIPAGVYNGSVNISLSLPSGFTELKIYYTIDGSEPDESSPVYSGPLSFQSSTTLRAKVIDTSYLPRPSTTQSYIITNRKLTLPVLSITTDTSYLFDPEHGIFVWGKEYISKYSEENEEYKFRQYSNLSHNWRRPMNIEYFDGNNHTPVINQTGEMRISGGGSRFQHEQKSFVVYANKRFGTKRFYHKFFNDKLPVEKGNGYKSLVVRNAGNDCSYAFMRDALIQNLYGGKTNADYLSYQPAIVYINGKYQGIENIRERSEDDYYLSNYNLKEDEIDMFDNSILQNGNETAFKALKNLVSGEFTYNQLNALVDIDNYLRYSVLYLFAWNADWPGNNYVFWRPSNGRFRWVLKDLDFGFGLDRGFSGDTAANSVFYILNPGVNSNAWAYNESNTFLFRRVLADKDSVVKQKFIDYYLVTLGDLLRENVIATMADSFAANIRTEYPFHATRWNGPQRYTAPCFRNDKALTPDNWEKEIQLIKRWAGARIRNVYDSLSAQFKLGAFVPLEVTTSTEDTAVILMNSIKVHYSSFEGKWPVGRPLLLSAADSINGCLFKKWEVTTISGTDTSEVENFTEHTLNLTNHITKNSSKILICARLEKLSGGIGSDKLQKTLGCTLMLSPNIVRNELIIRTCGEIKVPLKVELFDISGKVLTTCRMESGNLHLNLSGLSSNILLVSMTNGGNRQIFKILSR